MTDDELTDDVGGTVTVPVEPPREPGAYRPTIHYLQRRRDRVPEHDRGELTRTILRRGRVRRQPTRSGGEYAGERETDGVPVAFTADVGGRPWTVLAALRPSAWVDDEVKHHVVTIYEGEPDAVSERRAPDVARGGDA